MRLCAICALLAVLALQSCQQQEFEEMNLIRNSGFEETDGLVPVVWERRSEIAEGSRIYADSDAYSGTKSLCIEVLAEDAGQSLTYSSQFLSDFPTGTRLTLSGVIRTENLAEGSVVSLVARSLDDEGNLIGFSSSERTHPFTGTNNWTTAQTRFAVPDNAARLEVWTLLSGSGKVWFDDIELLHQSPKTAD